MMHTTRVGLVQATRWQMLLARLFGRRTDSAEWNAETPFTGYLWRRRIYVHPATFRNAAPPLPRQ